MKRKRGRKLAKLKASELKWLAKKVAEQERAIGRLRARVKDLARGMGRASARPPRARVRIRRTRAQLRKVQGKILKVLARSKRGFGVSELSKRTGTPRRKLMTPLRLLRRARKIAVHGSRRGARYVKR